MGKEGHYGLRGMSERTSVIGGQLVVWSKPNLGTEVELRVPARVAYAASRKLAKRLGVTRTQLFGRMAKYHMQLDGAPSEAQV